jgi:tetratricopeptide (TPR) repeat protein
MAKKKKVEKHLHTSRVRSEVDPTPKWALPLILILTFAAYISALNAGFVNWDDEDYIINNLLVRDISNLQALITTPVQGNYHPLTMISLAINYSISGLEAWSYHLFNLLFHLINCVLVFRLARQLSKQNFIIAFTTAILFAVHPMHVESVAWISERKDVLYTLFFLAGLISYTKFIDTSSKKQFWLTLLFLVLSLLSKPAAIVFPLVLFCIDLLRKRPFTIKLILEKIPFVVPAFVIGIMTYLAQVDVGSTGTAIFPLGSRILFGFYGIMMYLLKLFIPFNLSPFYPKPPSNESIPFEYLVSPAIFIALVILFYFSLRKNRVIAFGISFYLANLVLVLQVLTVGSAVIAERYTYVPYIGIFFALGWLIDHYFKSGQRKAFYIIIPVSILFSVLTYRQASIWHNGASLWDHVIETNPSPRAYAVRAALLRDEKDYNKALEYCTNAIQLNAAFSEAYVNRGNIYFDLKNYDLAYLDYKKSLELKPELYTTHENMGILFSTVKKYDSALVYFGTAIKLKPDNKQAYKNRGVTYLQISRYDEAIKDFQTFLIYEPNSPDIVNTIGHCLRVQSKFQKSLNFINKAIQMEPKPAYYLNRSYAYYGMGNLEMAKRDVLIAKQGGVQILPAYIQALGL